MHDNPKVNLMFVIYRNILQQSLYTGELRLQLSGQSHHKLKDSSQLKWQ